jgi:hypothetical protein
MSAVLEAALHSSAHGVAVLVKADHPDGMVRLWSGLGLIEIDAGDGDGEQVWTGVGVLGSCQVGEQSTENDIAEVRMTLSGVEPDLLAGLSASVAGRLATIWTAHLRLADMRPEIVRFVEQCVLEHQEFSDDGGSASITLVGRGGIRWLATRFVARWSAEDQIAFLTARGVDPATDTGFDYIASLANKSVKTGSE